MTDTPAPDAPPAPPPEPKPARWPEWFHVLDVAAAAIALAAVFLAASTTARNSTLFLHLAGGRALVQGQLTPGTDPFTHAGVAGRPWANTHWLFDLVAYALYSANPSGAALAAVKAAGVAVAIGLLFLLRPSGRPLFPWVLTAVLAAVAVADSVPLASSTVSVLFLAATLVFVVRLDWSRPGWRNPLMLGGLFLLWANSDGWFLLGPVVVLATWIGGMIDATLGWSANARRGLGRGLLVGLVACLLNPFVLAAVAKSPIEAATQLIPVELGLPIPPEVSDDIQLGSSLTLKPLSDSILNRLAAGDDPNLPALGLLAALSVAGAALSRSMVAGLLTLLGLIVGLSGVRLAPLSAMLLVPSVGWGLNRLAAWVPAGSADDPRTLVLIVGSGLGRFLILLLGLFVGAAALLGRMHPPRTDPAYGKVYAQRVEWAVEPDPALQRTATLLTTWPADRKALAVGPDLANYAAWFAPGVRQFVNTRYGFHRSDLPDLLILRVAAHGRRGGDRQTESADLEAAEAACDRQGGGYLVLTGAGTGRRVDDQNLVNKQMPAVFALTLYGSDRWTLWHLDGRSAVIGRGTGGPKFDPAALAFRPGEPLPAGPVTLPAPPPTGDAFDRAVAEVFRPLQPPPAEADDALALTSYLSLARQQTNEDHRRQTAPARGALTGGLGLLVSLPSFRPPTDTELAIPVLAARAARRSVVAAPDRPEPYRAVVVAYGLPLAPAADGPYSPAAGLLEGQPEVEAQQMVAAARFLARLPAEPNKELLIAGYQTALSLADRYQQTNQIDFARDTLERAVSLIRLLSGGGGKDDPVLAERKRLEEGIEGLSGQIQKQQRLAERETSPGRRILALSQVGLPGKAITLYRTTDPAAFGREVDIGGLTLRVVQLEMLSGRLEDASADLDNLEEALRTTPTASPVVATQVPVFRAVIARLAGDPRGAVGPTPAGAPTAVPVELARRLRDTPAVVTALTAAAGVAAGLDYQVAASRQSDGLVRAVVVEAARQTDRGLLALLDGDTTEAARRFDAALTPLGLPLAEFDAQLVDRLTRYRTLIRTHAGK